MQKLQIAYFGTPYFSAQFLEKVLTDTTINQLIEVEFVVTRPDQPVGRKQIITKSPVKEIAEKYKIPIIEDLKELQATSYKLQELDFAFLYAYGGIIPNNLLHEPRLGFLNTHPSLLPKYRGPSPIAYPLISGDTQTGVTLIQLDEKIDHGPIIMQEKITISPVDRRPDLEIKLTDFAFTIFKKLIIQLASLRVNELKTKKQNHELATFTRMLTKDDGFIPLSTFIKSIKKEPLSQNELPSFIGNWKLEIGNSAEIIYRLFRGLYLWPGIWTRIEPARLDNPVNDRTSQVNIIGKRLKITDMELINNQLILKKVQLEGKKEVDFETFNKAYKIFTP